MPRHILPDAGRHAPGPRTPAPRHILPDTGRYAPG
ncbi:MAG: hypothetical protein ACJA1R_002721, partial [Flavobacteriales bacterium]